MGTISRELTGMDEFAALLARILIGGTFAISGANDLIDFSGTIEEVAAAGIPVATLMVTLVAIAKFILGVLIVVKLQTKVAAFTLVIYEAITMLLFYAPYKWETYPQTEAVFYTSLAMLGGLLLLYAHARGNPERK